MDQERATATQPAANAMERVAASEGFDGPSIHSASDAQAMPIRTNGHASALMIKLCSTGSPPTHSLHLNL